MSANNGERGSTPVERWFDHAVRALTVTAIVGGFVGFAQLKENVAVIQSELGYLRGQFDRLSRATEDRYTAGDAAHDFEPLRERLSDHEARIRALERGR